MENAGRDGTNSNPISSNAHAKHHLLLVPLLQQLHVAPSLAVRSSQGGTSMLKEVRGRGHAATVRINPGVDVVGDIAAWNSPN